MKAINVMVAVIILLATTSIARAQNYNYKLDGAFQATKTINVNGVCDMCKHRIESALKVTGVTSAYWDQSSQTLRVQYNKLKITPEKIQQLVAAVGHDTEKFKAASYVYEKLPECCRYAHS